jgi:tRNA dimethylallyltransferase
MQVYRGMDIGTAKPSLTQREKIPHHLIDILNPDEQFNAGAFVRLAEETCRAAWSRGALPVVSGGTGFYVKNLVMGLAESPPSDKGVRLLLKKELENSSARDLMNELATVDPVSAQRIHINDEYRLLRALEVYRVSGRPLSSYSSAWSAQAGESARRLEDGQVEDARALRFLLIGLRRSREDLYRRINERTAAMFNAGLADEVRRLYEAGYTPEDPGLKAIGYKEFFVEDEGKTWRLSADMDGVRALVAQNSRRYAKRQITFFASLSDVKWVDYSGVSQEETAAIVRQYVREFAAGF